MKSNSLECGKFHWQLFNYATDFYCYQKLTKPFEFTVAEFQRIARRDKKAFLSDQCKQIEEDNRMRKTRDLFNIIRATKGTFHTKTGIIKDRNGMNLTEAEDIKMRSQEYTEELYKTDDTYSQKKRYCFSCFKLKNIFSYCLV